MYLILFHFSNILAPSTEENTTRPITNPPPKSIAVSTITLNPGQKTTEQSLKPTKPTNTLTMTSGVRSKYTQQPSINTSNQPTDRSKCEESCEQTNGDCYIYIIASIVVTALIVTFAICGSFFGIRYCRRRCFAKDNSRPTTTPSTQDIDDTNGNIQMDALSSENQSYTRDIETSE